MTGRPICPIALQVAATVAVPEPPRWIALSSRLMDELQLPAEVQEGFWWRNGARWLGIEHTLQR